MTRPLPPTRPAAVRRLPAAALASLLATAALGADVTPFDYHASSATLTYTIQIDGQAQTGKPGHGEWSSREVHQQLHGTLRLHGQRKTFARLDNPQEQISRTEGARQAMAGQMPAMEKIAEECGDDDNCVSTRMMALVNGLSPDKRKALAATAHGPAARTSQHARGDWSLDGKTACSLEASSREAARYRSVSDTEGRGGYVDGSEEGHGRASTDCLHDPYPHALAEWDGDTQALGLTLPGLTLTEQWKRSGGETETREVAIPEVRLDHLHWSGKGSKSGQQTRHVQADAGGGPVPATMTIRWTFTPGRA
ncbi:MAG TPA: hypothetical protein VFH59_13350 [Frateuria sp.]|uniref:hypothetical protein n=1 Tax=Frateuria sp. TaxID=2211372 RepID=UPI002D7E3050|nr:hypothetical protein [Frateuria sp.]HET6806417.1 hypothetical protein [Frateuria sp.]